MQYAPWPVDDSGGYRIPSVREIESKYGLSGEAVAETLAYFEERGGDVVRLVSLLNAHVLDSRFAISRDVLLDVGRWYSNEYYFYFIMFTKKVIGRYDFHYGEGSDAQLSRYHRVYEQGFLSCVPYGDGNEDVSNTIAHNMYQYYLKTYLRFTDLLVWIDILCAERGVAPYSVDIHPVKEARISSGLMCYIYDFMRILSNNNDLGEGVDGGIGNVSYYYLSLVPKAFIPSTVEKIVSMATSVYDARAWKRGKRFFFELTWREPYRTGKFGKYQASSFENSNVVTLRGFLLFIKVSLRLPEVPIHQYLTPLWLDKVLIVADLPHGNARRRLLYGGISTILFPVLYYFASNSRHSSAIIALVATIGLLVVSQLVISLIQERRMNKTLLSHNAQSLKEQERNITELESLAYDLVEEKKHLVEKVSERTAEIAAANRKLREYDRSKTEFFYNVSHELRTPLTLIKAPLESLVDGRYGRLTASQTSAARMALRNADRLHEQVNSLLDFASVDQGRIDPDMKPVDLAGLCAFYAAELAPRAEVSGISLETDLPSAPATARVDPRLFERAFFNVATNALKFTERGGRVTVSVRDDGEHVSVIVTDTGIGIPSDKIETIFERFVQVDGSSSRRYEGTGLGLALVKEVCIALGGTVSVASEPGTGSTFTLEFARTDEDPVPVTESAISPRRKSRESGEDPSADVGHPAVANESARATVLLVEDTVDMRSFIRDCLIDSYRVLEASNGEEALAMFRARQDIDIVVTDVMMPIMDGRAFHRAVAEGGAARAVPFLFVTARASSAEKVDALAEGAVDYIYKPFAVDELLAKVDSLLSLVRRGREAAAGEIESRVVAAIRGASPVLAPRAFDRQGKLDSFGLSAREAEVASRVIAGMRNKEIAAEFGLSERTVAHHVESIFRKSGAGSRIEFVAMCSANI